ncbi:MAG TPA: chromosome segregation protein SMC [Planctomycetes bacterium]|nr:chromosome segregation protein SMC [Planctomycetota bacterium]HIJ70371.1 chromosome segregation protein SMC [Planctomycetota bacterium]
MRLEKIVLNGFKSFADKTEFNFNRGITAIVGPNGCGKSNVVDAVKWVLGDQSPRSLRSGQMSDVIFGGSSSRKPSGMAQVSLHFLDAAGLGIEQEEVEISRRLYRSGQSEYLINNKPCRLRDIRELFMDTGVGVSAYSIIEQGQIGRLLQASNVDRRVIFEEAAGISKYKTHKKEALRKLERTEQNMLRVADILTEVQKQLRSIKYQAGKARNYLQYTEKLKELQVNYSLSQYHKIVTESNAKKKALSELEERFSSVAAQIARNDADLSRVGKSIIESEGEINRLDNRLVTTRSNIEQQLEHIRFLKKRSEELRQRKSTAAEQIRNQTAQRSRLNEELTGCKERLEENQEVFTQKKRRISELEEAINDTVGRCVSIEADLEDEKSGIIDIVRRTAQLHNEIQSINVYRSTLNGQKDRLSGRANETQLQLTELLTQKAQLEARFDDICNVMAELQESLGSKRSEMKDINSGREEISRQLADAKQTHSGLSSEFNLLSSMEAERQGLSKSVKQILQAKLNGCSGKHDYIEGIVADVISAEAGYATAIEAALEGKADALVINNTAEFLADDRIREELDSRVTLIFTDRIEPFADTEDFSANPSVIGRAVEFVRYQGNSARLAWQLLGHTIIVDSMDSAIELSHRLGPKYSFVTVEGEVLEAGRFMRVGPVGRAGGLISRKSRLSQLTGELAETKQQIVRLEEELERKSRQNEHLAKLCQNLRTSVYEASTEKVDIESRQRLIEQDIKRLSEEQPVITGEIEMLQRQLGESVQTEYDTKQKLTELEAINTDRTRHIEELEKHLSDNKAVVETKTSQLTDLKIYLGQIGEQQNSIKQQMTSLQSQLERGRGVLESAKAELSECAGQIGKNDEDILSSESKISELFMEKEKAQRMSTQMHEKVSDLLAEQKKTEELLREKRSAQSGIEQQMHDVELELTQLAVKNEDLTERVAEELQIDLMQAYEGFAAEEVDWDRIRTEIAELRGKIERLGNVNVDAIKEQADLEERYEFLSVQTEDLTRSKSRLEQLISRINKESREKFQATFDEVRKNFQEMFRKLFGGGKADIFLEDPYDILECGIEIIARPPGKETRSISLLSGGEKSLTALALLFAIFKSRPSPFCFLDEVDAALDEANIERFNMIVQEFQKTSQFIIITHSKRTMSIVDVLFGITMQTQGVSKRISVTFDEAETDADLAVA